MIYPAEIWIYKLPTFFRKVAELDQRQSLLLVNDENLLFEIISSVHDGLSISCY